MTLLDADEEIPKGGQDVSRTFWYLRDEGVKKDELSEAFGSRLPMTLCFFIKCCNDRFAYACGQNGARFVCNGRPSKSSRAPSRPFVVLVGFSGFLRLTNIETKLPL